MIGTLLKSPADRSPRDPNGDGVLDGQDTQRFLSLLP
jgi:hypothetical protein